MAPKCCVPGCRSNYTYRSKIKKGYVGSRYVSVFKLPTDPELKEKWLKCIPRKNWTPSKSSVVCAKHFLVSDIIVSDKYIDKSGVEHEVPRKNTALKKNAYPAVFSEGIAAYIINHPRSKISTSTVCEKLTKSRIVKNKDVIKSTKVTKGVKLICKQRSETLEQVEQLLLKWITEIQCTSDSVTEAMICERAKLIHADLLKNKARAKQKYRKVFKASHSWFVSFKKRNLTAIHNVTRHGEGASADKDATDNFVTNTTYIYIKQEGLFEVKQEKTEYDTDGEVDTLEDKSSASDLNNIDNYVSSHSPSHNTHTCADVEENRMYNSHSSVCVRENVLSDKTSNHQVITSENIKEEMCYTEDVRSGEGKNKQTQKEATESVSVIDFQAMMAGVRDGCNENREELHQEHNNFLEQRLSACKKTSKHQQNDANIVMCGRKYLDEIFVNKWKTNSAASQKSSQSHVLQSVQPTSVLQSVQPTSVLQSVQPTSVLHSVRPTSSLQSDQSISSLQSDQPTSILQSVQPISVLQSVQPTSILQSDQPSVLRCDQSLVLQTEQPSVLHSDQPSVVQSFKCKFCHHRFVLNSSLKEHRLVQRGILPHICGNCGNAFRLNTVLMKDTNEQTVKKADDSAQFDDTLYKRYFSGGICQQSIIPQKHKQLLTGEKPYKCHVCDRRFATGLQLFNHNKIHSGVKPYQCDVCGCGFATSSNLIHHKRTHSEVKPYKCHVCDRGFAKDSDMKKHTRTHTGEKPHLCEICGRGFAKKYSLKIHTRTHTGDRSYNCDVCFRRFILKSSLDIHKLTHTGEKPHLCEICGRGFAKTYGLKMHTRTHTGDRSYNCDVCFRGFVLKGSLDIHKLTHTDEKPYQCDTCGLTFKNTSGLIQHTRTHIEGKPFKCDVCGRGYRSKFSLALHTKTHRGEKPEGECDICGKNFMYKSYLKVHKRVHTQERPYKCDVCEASFRIASALKPHKLMHTGEKPYMCDICGFRVSRKSNLRLHKKVHTQERPYKCDVCGATYRQSSSLNTHKLIHTGEKPYLCDICGFRANLKYRLKLHKKVHKS